MAVSNIKNLNFETTASDIPVFPYNITVNFRNILID